jgi:ATP synthase protein I
MPRAPRRREVRGTDRQRKPDLSNTAKAMQGAMPWVGAVWKFVGGAVVGVIAGMLLDKWLGWTPWGLVALAIVGIVVGFYGFIHDVTKLQKGKG